MVFWSVVAYLIIIVAAWLLIRRRRQDLPVFVNGMIPGLPGAESKAESGSTAFVFYSDTE